jgi:hypothetical protein
VAGAEEGLERPESMMKEVVIPVNIADNRIKDGGG